MFQYTPTAPGFFILAFRCRHTFDINNNQTFSIYLHINQTLTPANIR